MSDFSEAWAVVEGDGTINVRSVSLTRRGAVVNWLCTEKGVVMTMLANDASIEAFWGSLRHKADVVRVVVTRAPSTDAGKISADEARE